MNIAVIQFPGSNCDYDAYYAFADVVGLPTKMIWHKEQSLGDADIVIVPGGFSYGDYLRCGAIARFSPIMMAIFEFAENGGVVLGICNGFQILCEAKLLPGALLRNSCLEFRCLTADLKVENSTEHFNNETLGDNIRIPIAHGEGNYRISSEELDTLESNKQILLRYADPTGNPNGSINNIAGIRNKRGNVFGMMPHPERAIERFHSTTDGLKILKSLVASVNLAKI